MDQSPAFGPLLKTYRKARDLTQEQLAERAACSVETIKKIEAGKFRPSRQLAQLLAEALDIPTSEQAAFVQAARSVGRVNGRSVSPPAPSPTGDHPGLATRGYELRECIGSGSSGLVYRALQPHVGREVAIKIILPQYADHPDFIRRFAAEAQLVARLEHPHIVPLYDYWREGSSAYLVMRLLRGGSLPDLLQQAPLPRPLTVLVVDQVGAALQPAHRAGVVLPPPKPANIL